MFGKLGFGNWYVRFDLTISHGYNVLLGFNYVEGVFTACTDASYEDCFQADYGEFQIGFLVFTISIGKETIRDKVDLVSFPPPIEYEQRDKDNADLPIGAGSADKDKDKGTEGKGDPSPTSNPS